jgi:hypothetical protein
MDGWIAYLLFRLSIEEKNHGLATGGHGESQDVTLTVDYLKTNSG